jgi:hypothetical protein
MSQGRVLVLAALTVLSAAAVPLAAAPLPDSRLGVRTVPLLLLSRPDVQADLAMTPAQVAEAERAVAALHARASKIRGKTGEEALAARRAIDEEQQHWIDTQLSETQRVRIIQIDLQWEGVSSLVSRPSMAEALALRPDQIATLKRLSAESRQRRAGGADPRAVERDHAAKALELLTEAQRTSWKAMLGRPFQPQIAQAEAAPKNQR